MKLCTYEREAEKGGLWEPFSSPLHPTRRFNLFQAPGAKGARFSSRSLPFPPWLSAPPPPAELTSEPSPRVEPPSYESDVHAAIVLLYSRLQMLSS